jgi:hypothetical protein
MRKREKVIRESEEEIAGRQGENEEERERIEIAEGQ